MALRCLGSHEEAIEFLSEATKREPNNVDFLCNRSQCLMDPEVSEALKPKPFENVLSFFISFSFFVCARFALVMCKVADPKGAELDLSAAIRLVNTDPKLFYRRGIARYMQHNFPGAVRDLRTSLDLLPSRTTIPDVYRYLGLAFANSEGDLHGRAPRVHIIQKANKKEGSWEDQAHTFKNKKGNHNGHGGNGDLSQSSPSSSTSDVVPDQHDQDAFNREYGMFMKYMEASAYFNASIVAASLYQQFEQNPTGAHPLGVVKILCEKVRKSISSAKHRY